MNNILSVQTELSIYLVGIFLLLGYALAVGNGCSRHTGPCSSEKDRDVLGIWAKLEGSQPVRALPAYWPVTAGQSTAVLAATSPYQTQGTGRFQITTK